jgi:hypothetical protein
MCGAKQNYFYLTNRRDWVCWGPDRRTLPNADSLELGDPRLAYGFALATSTLVRPGAVEMTARRIVATTEEGGRLFIVHFTPCRSLKRRKLAI